MRLAALAFASLLLCACAPAAEGPVADDGLYTAEDMRPVCDAALEKLVADDYDGAFKVLEPHWAPGQEKGAAYLVPAAHYVRGNVLGTNFVRQQFYSEAFVRFQYEIHMVDGDPQHFACVFSRQGEPWKFSQVVWGEFTMHVK
jgi:hypothetical protein